MTSNVDTSKERHNFHCGYFALPLCILCASFLAELSLTFWLLFARASEFLHAAPVA